MQFTKKQQQQQKSSGFYSILLYKYRINYQLYRDSFMKDFCVHANYPNTYFILTSLSINDEHLQYKIQTKVNNTQKEVPAILIQLS